MTGRLVNSKLTREAAAAAVRNHAGERSSCVFSISKVATIGVRQGALHGEFTTRNTLEADRRIHLQLVSGPFRTLEGEWQLTPIEPEGCRVELTMRFAFANRLTAVLFEPKFAAIIGSLMDAFVARARSLP